MMDFLKLSMTSLLVGSFTLLGACSFQKDPDKKKNSPTPIIIQQQDTSPKTALEAIRADDTKSLELHLQKMTVEQINAYQKDGSTLLELAVRDRNYQATELLINYGALPLKPLTDPSTHLLEVAEKNSPAIFSYLSKEIQKRKDFILSLVTEQKYRGAATSLSQYLLALDVELSQSQNLLDLWFFAKIN